MATSIKYRSVNGKNGNTTANNIPVIAKCFALSSVIDENFEVNFEKKVNSVFLAEFKFIKNLPKIQSPTNKKTTFTFFNLLSFFNKNFFNYRIII